MDISPYNKGIMEHQQKNTRILIVVTTIVALAVGYYIYKDVNKTLPGGEAPLNATTTSAVGNNATSTTTTISVPLPQPVPTFGRVLPAGVLPDDARTIVVSNIAKYTAELTKDPRATNTWIALGLQYKMAGDYAGAEEAWTYATRLSSKNIVPFYNLGDLYYGYLKDPVKSEANFKTVIALDSTYTAAYRALFDLYRYAYPAKQSLAPEILLQGIKQSEDPIDLTILLAGYYKDTGDIADARTYYQKAIVLASQKNNTALAAMIQKELDALK